MERADLRGVALWQGALDPAPDTIRKRADDLLLDDEKITNLPVVGVGPEMRSVMRIQQLGGHFQSVSDLLLAAFEQVVDAEFISNLPDVNRLVAVPEARVPRDDGISLAPRKLGNDPLGDGIAEISLSAPALKSSKGRTAILGMSLERTGAARHVSTPKYAPIAAATRTIAARMKPRREDRVLARTTPAAAFGSAASDGSAFSR